MALVHPATGSIPVAVVLLCRCGLWLQVGDRSLRELHHLVLLVGWAVDVGGSVAHGFQTGEVTMIKVAIITCGRGQSW